MQPGGQFDMGNGQVDMQALLAQAQAVMTAQAEIAATEVEGQAGNGLVRVRVLATGEVRSLEISPQIVDPSDVETLQDLVAGAINNAMGNAQKMALERLGPLASMPGQPGGQIPGMPGQQPGGQIPGQV